MHDPTQVEVEKADSSPLIQPDNICPVFDLRLPQDMRAVFEPSSCFWGLEYKTSLVPLILADR